MTAVVQSNGTKVTKSTVQGNMTDVTPTAQKLFRYTGVDLFQSYTLPGKSTFEGDRKLVFKNNALYTQAQIDAAFLPATFVSCTPNTGAHGSTTAVVIKGTNLGGATGVTFDGNAGTSFSVVDDNTINVTAPTNASAKTADIVITDNSGTVTATGAFIYT